MSLRSGALSSLVIVQLAVSPGPSVILFGEAKVPPPVQTQMPFDEYPDGPPLSPSAYWTLAVTLFGPFVASVPVAGLPAPVNPPLPAAASVHAEASAVPPLLLITCLFNVS